MKFRDLEAQYQRLKPEIDHAIQKVLEESSFIGGKQVKELEKKLADYVGVKHCITCANGTDALSLIMMAWDIGKGDAVFVPDFTFFSSGEIVCFAGATPVFYDVCRNTYNADVKSLEKAIEAVICEGLLTPRAIIAVDLFGQPADYLQLELLARKYGLLLFEDGAQGFGGRIGTRKVCSFGDAATTSFFPAKPLGCYGDGGAIFTNDDEKADYLRSICVHGKGKCKYDNVRIGMNSRLDTIQAAILNVKLKAFVDFELEAVNRVADIYSKNLEGIVEIPRVLPEFYSSWAQYTICLGIEDDREKLQVSLREKGIPAMVYYPKPMHLQTAFRGGRMYVNCPKTEMLCSRVLSLPMHPYLMEDEQMVIIEAIHKELR